MTRNETVRFPLTRQQDLANPYPTYRHYRETDPVHLVTGAGGQADTWYLFRYRDVAHVLSSQSYGRSALRARSGLSPVSPLIPERHSLLREVVDNWLVFLDPPRHTRLRSQVLARFSSGVVNGLRPRIEDIATELLAGLKTECVIDLVEDYAAPLPILVVMDLLGVSRRHGGWMRECARALQGADSAKAEGGTDRYAGAEAAARRLRDFFQEEVQRRRHQQLDDVTGSLVRSVEGVEPLTDEEVVATCIHLLTAGHETTANLISKSVLALLDHPHVLEELRTTSRLMPNAVDELVRYDPPVQMISRWAYGDDLISGRTIRRGSKVILVLGSANRDPDQFNHPETLDIRRHARRHCGFGLGIHYCLGAALARIEAEIALTALLQGLPQLALGKEPVRYADDMIFHGPERMLLQIKATA